MPSLKSTGGVLFRRSPCVPVLSPAYSGAFGAYAQIVSGSRSGQVVVRWPLGFAWPSSSRAVAVPPSLPGYQVSSTDFTESRHGMRTATSLFRTTAVLGLALAMVWMRSTVLGSRDVTFPG